MRILPLIESVGQVCSDWLLSVRNVHHPVLSNLSDLNEKLPSIEADVFLWVSISVVLQASYGSSHEASNSFVGQVAHLANLVWVVSLSSHEVFQVIDIKAVLKHFFNNWAYRVHIDDGLVISSSTLPPHESISHSSVV